MDDIERIYKEYFFVVYKYLLCLTHDFELAEELTQDTFEKAIMKINTFKGESKISTWLISIAKNLYFNELKRSRKNIDINEIKKQMCDECIEDIIVLKEEKELLKEKINKLDEISRKVVFF